MGVREYLIAVPLQKEISCFERIESGFQPLPLGADGVFRSRCFPGLWLDTKALWDLDRPRRNACLEKGLATPEHAKVVAELVSRNTEHGKIFRP